MQKHNSRSFLESPEKCDRSHLSSQDTRNANELQFNTVRIIMSNRIEPDIGGWKADSNDHPRIVKYGSARLSLLVGSFMTATAVFHYRKNTAFPPVIVCPTTESHRFLGGRGFVYSSVCRLLLLESRNNYGSAFRAPWVRGSARFSAGRADRAHHAAGPGRDAAHPRSSPATARGKCAAVAGRIGTEKSAAEHDLWRPTITALGWSGSHPCGTRIFPAGTEPPV
jgi:hypothetical protein